MTGKDPISVIQEVVRNTHSPGVKGSESVSRYGDARGRPAPLHCRSAHHVLHGRLTARHGARGAGSFPRVLGLYVREEKALPLEAAIRKMTSLPALRMGFRDRGRIRPGMKADIVVFDPNTVIDTATTANPTSPPIGIPDVLVNGVPVLEAGRYDGRASRHGAAPYPQANSCPTVPTLPNRYSISLRRKRRASFAGLSDG